MPNQVGNGADLGTVLIALAAVIAIGFAIFGIAKAVANDGATRVQDSIHMATQSVYQEFDQKVVNGQQVLNSFTAFGSQPIAILISSQGTQNSKTNYVRATGADKLGAKGIDAPTGVTRKIGGVAAPAGTGIFINYNAILSSGKPISTGYAVASNGQTTGTDSATVDLISGSYVCDNTVLLDAGGNVVYDTNTGRIFRSGDKEFISTTAKFEANLVRDLSGSVIGIAFVQLK